MHIPCIVHGSRTIDKPISVLFMELLLASNGCVLSDRFLDKVGRLSRHHTFGIIVDEILTGARTPSLLLTCEKPDVFVEQVAYVTLGKWCKCGVVLTGCQHDEELHNSKKLLDARGVTTAILCKEPLPYFKQVQTLLQSIPRRRSISISKIANTVENDTWGIGLIIFIPRRCCGTRMGTKNRLLPLLNDTPVFAIPTTYEPAWTKSNVSRKTQECVLNWTKQPFFIQTEYEFESNLHCLYAMVSFLIKHDFPDDWTTTSVLHDSVTNVILSEESATRRVSTNILRSLERAGFIKKQMKTSQRLQGWTIITSNIQYPWIRET